MLLPSLFTEQSTTITLLLPLLTQQAGNLHCDTDTRPAARLGYWLDSSPRGAAAAAAGCVSYSIGGTAEARSVYHCE